MRKLQKVFCFRLIKFECGLNTCVPLRKTCKRGAACAAATRRKTSFLLLSKKERVHAFVLHVSVLIKSSPSQLRTGLDVTHAAHGFILFV